MSKYERDYVDPAEAPCWENGDEPQCNTSANPTFYDVMEARLARRDVLFGGLATAVTAVFGVPFLGQDPARAASSPLLGFQAVMISEADSVTVPAGYKVQVLIPWGTPLMSDGPAFSYDNTGADQEVQIGTHHDGIHYFPIDGSSTDGFLVLNHEYVEPRFLHGSTAGMSFDRHGFILENGERNADEALKELHAHGVSVVHVTRGADGAWAVTDDPLNRRIHGLTEMEIAGPARGAAHMVTKFSPDGTRTRGTLNDCAHGVTPWNTYLGAEENWAGYFTNTDTIADSDTGDDVPNLPREHARYGVRTGMSRYGWELAAGGDDRFIRFDASTRGATAAEDYRNEPNTFGWIVEIDPFDANKTPVKHTLLGRFAHEGVIFAPVEAGKPMVCYSGDDARFEYIYKFVSAEPYDPATASGALFDTGTLYVAKFNEDGTGVWLALEPGQNGLTPENGFADLADILVNTRLAGDTVGATKMDRPEWGAVDPNTGEVYFTLTNNTRRTEGQLHPANPRANNQFGQIIRWTEAGGDHASTSFDWDLFVIAGDADDSRDLSGAALGDTNIFAAPDGLWFDADARLWIQSDIGEDNQNVGAYAVFGNNAMLAADPRTGEIRRFLTGPIGQEITGVISTPDQRTFFVNVQHPGATTSAEDFSAGSYVSHWPDGGDARPRCATLVITREDGGVVGS